MLFRSVFPSAAVSSSAAYKPKVTSKISPVDKEVREKVEILVEQMAEQWGVTKELKMQDQMEWVRRMNTIKNVAEENILKNGVYK